MTAPTLPGMEAPLTLADLDPLHGITWILPDGTAGVVAGTYQPPEGPYDTGGFGVVVRRPGVRTRDLVELTMDEARRALEATT